jgi:hypothetical protein
MMALVLLDLYLCDKAQNKWIILYMTKYGMNIAF